jgi:hypothetical protein
VGVGYVRHFTDLLKIKVVGIPWLVANAIGDVLITSILVWHLVSNLQATLLFPIVLTNIGHVGSQAGLKSGIAATDYTINRIIRGPYRQLSYVGNSDGSSTVTVETGLITSICAVVDLITFLAIVRLSHLENFVTLTSFLV